MMSEPDINDTGEQSDANAETPDIEVGSEWAFRKEVPKRAHQTFTVANIYIPAEELVLPPITAESVHVTLDYGADTDEPDESVTMADMQEQIDAGDLVRVNNGHEAWDIRADGR